MERTETERLIALLHAQRDEAALRSRLARHTPAWSESCTRLGDLNDQIMHVGARGSTAREVAGDGPAPVLGRHPLPPRRARRLT